MMAMSEQRKKSMHQRASKIIDLFERVVNLIRPKAYNTIAKLVVSVGLLQIAESYAKILHAFVIALFEENIGKSEVLRSFLNATSDPTAGVILVLSGLVYHLTVTLGKDYIDTKRAELPKYPSLQCILLNGDKSLLSSEFTIRGCRVNLPCKKDIPDNKDIEPNYNDPRFGSALRLAAIHNSMLITRRNKSLFRERAQVLSDWAGAELIFLSVTNDGSILASGLSVVLRIPRHKGVYVSMPGHLPDMPKDEIDPFRMSLLDPIKTHDPRAISISSDVHHYQVTWNIFKMQAKTEEISTDGILLKTDRSLEIECTIFCDELPEPIVTTYITHPAPEIVNIDLNQLINSESYNDIRDKVIMDGYELRAFQLKLERYQMDGERYL